MDETVGNYGYGQVNPNNPNQTWGIVSAADGVPQYGWVGTPQQQITSDANTTANRQQMVNLIGTTTAAYNKLMQAGRDNDAFALRDAMERYARTGSQLGVNPWAKTQAINDLRARMTAAASVLQGTTTAQALSAQGSILGQISNLDERTVAGWRAQQALDESKRVNLWNQQQEMEAKREKAIGGLAGQQGASSGSSSTSTTTAPNRIAPLATAAPEAPYNNSGNPFVPWRGVTLQPGQKWGWSSGLPATGASGKTSAFPPNYAGGTAWGEKELKAGTNWGW